MKKIAAENLRIERFTLRAEALELMKDEPYKLELIHDLPEGEEISFYKQGEFTDLCAGPHVAYTKKLKAFKLTQATGAYWRGDSTKKMLVRIYGTAFATKEELESYLAAGRRPEARPQQARPPARTVHHLGGDRARAADHPAERDHRPAHPPALGRGRRGKTRLPANENAVYGQTRAVQNQRPLGPLPRRDVRPGRPPTTRTTRRRRFSPCGR